MLITERVVRHDWTLFSANYKLLLLLLLQASKIILTTNTKQQNNTSFSEILKSYMG